MHHLRRDLRQRAKDERTLVHPRVGQVERRVARNEVAKEDDVDANMLTAVIQADPLMTLKLLARMGMMRRPGSDTETESITTSLILMGIGPFFRHFGPQPTIERWLADQDG